MRSQAKELHSSASNSQFHTVQLKLRDRRTDGWTNGRAQLPIESRVRDKNMLGLTQRPWTISTFSDHLTIESPDSKADYWDGFNLGIQIKIISVHFLCSTCIIRALPYWKIDSDLILALRNQCCSCMELIAVVMR